MAHSLRHRARISWREVRAVLVGVVLLIGGSRNVRAQSSPPPQRLLLSSGTAAFAATATFGDFTGTTSALVGHATSPGGPLRASGQVEVYLDSLRTGNSVRDGHMRAALETEQFRVARFVLDSMRAVSGLPTAGARPVHLHGRFTVHGVERAVMADGRLEEEVNGAWRLAVRFPVTLAEHNISKGLSRMFGTIRVGPEVVVSVDMRFAP